MLYLILNLPLSISEHIIKSAMFHLVELDHQEIRREFHMVDLTLELTDHLQTMELKTESTNRLQALQTVATLMIQAFQVNRT